MTSLVAYEDNEMINVCVKILGSDYIDCPVAFPFDLIIQTRDGTAGKPSALYIGE